MCTCSYRLGIEKEDQLSPRDSVVSFGAAGQGQSPFDIPNGQIRRVSYRHGWIPTRKGCDTVLMKDWHVSGYESIHGVWINPSVLIVACHRLKS